jgi:uncharacterized protein YbjT (DUF2867 family)
MSQDINELSQRYCGDEIGLIGATGNLGGRVARELADQGCFVRLIVRQPKKLQNSVHTVVFGDLDSPETLPSAMKGLKCLIVITSDNTRQYVQGASAINAAKLVGVSRIVLVSAMLAGEHVPRSFAARHAGIEREVRASGLEYVILRPSVFMQSCSNFTNFKNGHMVVPVPSGSVAFVDAQDVASAVVQCAINPLSSELKNSIRVLTGDESVSFKEAAIILSSSVGVSVKHKSPPLLIVKFILPWLVGREMASMLSYMFSRLEDGREAKPTGDLQRLLGRKPKTLSECFTREKETLVNKY